MAVDGKILVISIACILVFGVIITVIITSSGMSVKTLD